MIAGIVPLHLASRYFDDPILAMLGLIAFCAVLVHFVADLQMLWAMPQRKCLRRPRVRLAGRNPELNTYAVLMALGAALIFIGAFDVAGGNVVVRMLLIGGFLLVGLEAASRAVLALYYWR